MAVSFTNDWDYRQEIRSVIRFISCNFSCRNCYINKIFPLKFALYFFLNILSNGKNLYRRNKLLICFWKIALIKLCHVYSWRFFFASRSNKRVFVNFICSISTIYINFVSHQSERYINSKIHDVYTTAVSTRHFVLVSTAYIHCLSGSEIKFR